MPREGGYIEPPKRRFPIVVRDNNNNATDPDPDPK